MKSRGFTLIELLTIISVLSIIALIAAPVVTNVKENNRRKAAEASIANIEHAADIYYYNNGGLSETIFICDGGVCSDGQTVLDVNGNIPESGQIRIDKDGNITLSSLIIDGYLCYKKDNNYICEKNN